MILTCSICDKRLGELPADASQADQMPGNYAGYVRLREAPRSPVCHACLAREYARVRGGAQPLKRWTLRHWPDGARSFADPALFTVETMGRK